MRTQYVDCVLTSGFFEDELYVIVGESSAIVSRSEVEVAREPHGQRDGAGKVRVYIIQNEGNRVLVELPGEPVVGGLRTWIEPIASPAAA